METWLRTTIWGIIVLGAVGSIAAVAVLKMSSGVIKWLWGRAQGLHLRIFLKQAYMHGYTARMLTENDNYKMMTPLYMFRMSRFLIAIILVAACWVVFFTALMVQPRTALTPYTYLPVLLAFLAMYWLYYEFEFFYRMYLTWWKAPYARANEAYEKRQKERSSDKAWDASTETE